MFITKGNVKCEGLSYEKDWATSVNSKISSYYKIDGIKTLLVV